MADTKRPAPATEPVPFVTADPEPEGYAIPSLEETAAHRATQGDVSWSTSGTTEDDMVSVMDVKVGDTILSPAHHHPVGPRVVRAIEETGLGRTLRFTNRTIAGFYRNHRVTMIARATAGDESTPAAPAVESPTKARMLANLDRSEAEKLAESRPELFELTDTTAEVIRAVLAGEPAREVAAARRRGYVRWDYQLGHRIVTPMGQVAYERHTPAPEPTLAQRQAAGLRVLADMIEANPGLAANFAYTLGSSGIYVMSRADDTATEMATVARIARRYGAKTDKIVSEKQYNLMADFGAVKFQFLASREEVCERVVTGTREVVEEVPDPVALAAVPTTTVTRVVEDVEWVCRPLLAADQNAPVSA